MIKLDRILCLLAIGMIPQLASAEIPFTAQSMANLQATIDFCGQNKPKEAAIYREELKRFVQSLPEKEVAVVLESDDYKSTYESISAALATLGQHEADETCQRLLAPKK